MDEQSYKGLTMLYNSTDNVGNLYKKAHDWLEKRKETAGKYSEDEILYTLNRISDMEAARLSDMNNSWRSSDMIFANKKLCEPQERIAKNKVKYNGKNFNRIVGRWINGNEQSIMLLKDVLPELPCICEDEKGNMFTVGYDLSFTWEDIVIGKKRYPHMYSNTVVVPIGAIDFEHIGNLVRYVEPLTVERTYDFPNGGKNNYDVIMNAIIAGLENNKDAINYLTLQKERFRDHEYADEIAKICDNLLSRYSEPTHYEENMAYYINRAYQMINEGDIESALLLARGLYNTAVERDLYEDDELIEYHSFHEMMEKVVYLVVDRPKKQIINLDFPFSMVYLLYGSVLIEKKLYAQAREMLQKALRWNPVNFMIRSEYLRLLRNVPESTNDEYREFMQKTLDYVFRRRDMAGCLNDVGEYMIDVYAPNMLSIAYGVYKWSLVYDPENQQAIKEMALIKERKDFNGEPKRNEFLALAQNFHVYIGFNKDVENAAQEYYSFAKKEQIKEMELYFGSIINEFGITSNMLPFEK